MPRDPRRAGWGWTNEPRQIFAEFGEIGRAEGVAEDGGLAGGGEKLGGDDAGEGALAAAVGAEDRRARAGGDGPLDIAEDPSIGAITPTPCSEIARGLHIISQPTNV